MTDFARRPGPFSDPELMGSTLGHLLQSVDIPLLPESLERRVDLALLHALARSAAFNHIFSFVEEGGYYSANGFLDWLAEQLDAGGRAMSQLTLAELHGRTGRHLSVVTTDSSAATMVVLNHLTAPQVPVLWAVRMSMSIPLFWPEVIWRAEWGQYRGQDLSGHAMVDGGVVSNFALRLLLSDEQWVVDIMGGRPDPETHVLGLYLDANEPVPHAPPSTDAPTEAALSRLHSKSLARLERIANSALSGNDNTEMSNYEAVVCRLPVGGYGVTEFNMSPARIDALLDSGERAMADWLRSRGGPGQVGKARRS
jgi:predicted acylesterase/phospholipase RssA